MNDTKHIPWPIVEGALLDLWSQATAALFSMQERAELEVFAEQCGKSMPDGLSYGDFCKGAALAVHRDVGEMRLLLAPLDARTLRRAHREIKRLITAYLEGGAWQKAEALATSDGDDGAAWMRETSKLLRQVRGQMHQDAQRDVKKKKATTLAIVPTAAKTTVDVPAEAA